MVKNSKKTSFDLYTRDLPLACREFPSRKIVLRSVRDGNGEIYKMDAAGRNQNRLTFNDSPDSSPVWSPNGQQIASMGERDKNWDVYVMDTDGEINGI